VEIRVDWSLAIIFALITADLALVVLPSWHPEWGAPLVWGVALAAAVLFFGSVLAHEMSHALVGRAQGVEVRRITLFLFGGMAHLEGRPETPKAELLTAIVGPLTSLAIGAAALAIGAALAGPELTGAAAMAAPEQTLSQLGPMTTLLLWLGPINIALALFNMVPGFPLDGGRVLRAALWAWMGDLPRATRWASRSGQLFALLLMALGVVSVLGGLWVQGFWFVLIGWFLHRAARRGYEQVALRESLEGVAVHEIMRTSLRQLAPSTTLAELAREVLHTEETAFGVATPDGELAGLVTLADARRVPRDQWDHTPVGAVMTPRAELPTLGEQAHADHALRELESRGVEQLGVERDGDIVGIVRRRDVFRWLVLQPDLAPGH